MQIVFQPWPKIQRVENVKNKEIYTEKIDGTNACIVILNADANTVVEDYVLYQDQDVKIFAQSRSKLIKVGDDNFGFAGWVKEHAEELKSLGEGYHYGEWWGQGIQRGYGLDHKKFSLFNTKRWNPQNPNKPNCCDVVPIIEANSLEEAAAFLIKNGSLAAPGYFPIEGVVIYNYATDTLLKHIINK